MDDKSQSEQNLLVVLEILVMQAPKSVCSVAHL